MAADTTYPSTFHLRQDGTAAVPTGQSLDIESGASFKIAGTAVTATAAELNRAADTSARLVAAGSTLTLTEAAHDGKTICLDTAAGCTITLPAATGSGMILKFLVTVKPTSNQHRINVVGNDAFFGSVDNGDADATTQLFFAAGTDADQINLNGGTTGGQKGDWIILEDMLADCWHVRGATVCPTGSNSATCFATGQVT